MCPPRPVTLVHPSESRHVAGCDLYSKCTLFGEDPALLGGPYTIRSRVTLINFRTFTSALEGVPITVTSGNKSDLTQLSEEFGYEDLRQGLAQFQGTSQNWLVPSGDLQNITAAISGLRGPTLKIEDLSSIIAALQNGNGSFCARPQPALGPPVSQLDSWIATELPTEILQEMQGKAFRLLWRASRDGFNARQFHIRCNGHANTLTLVKDVGENIFGGFTPIEWKDGPKKSPGRSYGIEGANFSFLFTLKNPSGLAPMKFSCRLWANMFREDMGPSFGDDIGIADNSDGNMESCTDLGHDYANYTGRDGKTVFTGAYHFRSREIEVFELTG
jgi:hypothetical protein